MELTMHKPATWSLRAPHRHPFFCLQIPCLRPTPSSAGGADVHPPRFSRLVPGGSSHRTLLGGRWYGGMGLVGWHQRALGILVLLLASAPDRAGLLSNMVDQPVVDMTQLKGVYAVVLEWSVGDAAGNNLESTPSLSSELQEKLGLRLDTRKTAVDFYVIDHVERVPSDN